MRQYGDAPEVEVFGGENFTFAYVPGHLHQMLFELVKNSLRAVSDKYLDSARQPPPIRVVRRRGAEDVTIKISDEGGGIRRSGLQRIWTYLYTTADSPLLQSESDSVGGGGGGGGARGAGGIRLRPPALQALRQVLRGGPAGHQHGRVRERTRTCTSTG